MTVHSSAFDAVFGSDPLGRFTAAVVSTVPEFDPADTPIGHALAAELFHRQPARRPSPRPRIVGDEPAAVEVTGTVLELPVAPAGSADDWFGVTTEPDEELGEPARRAS